MGRIRLCIVLGAALALLATPAAALARSAARVKAPRAGDLAVARAVFEARARHGRRAPRRLAVRVRNRRGLPASVVVLARVRPLGRKAHRGRRRFAADVAVLNRGGGAAGARAATDALTQILLYGRAQGGDLDAIVKLRGLDQMDDFIDFPPPRPPPALGPFCDDTLPPLPGIELHFDRVAGRLPTGHSASEVAREAADAACGRPVDDLLMQLLSGGGAPGGGCSVAGAFVVAGQPDRYQVEGNCPPGSVKKAKAVVPQRSILAWWAKSSGSCNVSAAAQTNDTLTCDGKASGEICLVFRTSPAPVPAMGATPVTIETADGRSRTFQAALSAQQRPQCAT